MLFERQLKRRAQLRQWRAHVNVFFDRIGANAIGTHGTSSAHLDSIREKGLWAKGHDTRYTYFRMSKRDILKILGKSGRMGLLRRFVSVIQANLGAYEDAHLPFDWNRNKNRRFPLSDYGLVVGKANVPFRDDFMTQPNLAKPGFWGFNKENVLLTLKLSPEEIADLVKRHGTDHFVSNEQSKEADRLRRAVAFKFARKMLSHLREFPFDQY